MAERLSVVCDKCNDPKGCQDYQKIEALEKAGIVKERIDTLLETWGQICAGCPTLNARIELVRRLKRKSSWVLGEDTVDLPGSK